MTIGEKIKEVRMEKGLKQKELAALAGIPTITLQQYERGVTKNPQVEQLQKIALALHVPISVFLSVLWETNPPSDEEYERIIRRAGQRHETFWGRRGRSLFEDERISQADDAEREHLELLEDICFDPRISPDFYRERVRYVTAFIKQNADMLRKAMPGAYAGQNSLETMGSVGKENNTQNLRADDVLPYAEQGDDT